MQGQLKDLKLTSTLESMPQGFEKDFIKYSNVMNAAYLENMRNLWKRKEHIILSRLKEIGQIVSGRDHYNWMGLTGKLKCIKDVSSDCEKVFFNDELLVTFESPTYENEIVNGACVAKISIKYY